MLNTNTVYDVYRAAAEKKQAEEQERNQYLWQMAILDPHFPIGGMDGDGPVGYVDEGDDD